MGDYDVLYEPKVISSGWDHICFTNNKSIKKKPGSVWTIKYVSDKKLSDEKLARKVKMKYWEFLKGYDINIWIDANIQIKHNLNAFMAGKNDSFYIMNHPDRITALDEVNFCVNRDKDKSNILHKQMQDYIADGFPDKDGLCASGLIIRRHNVSIMNLMIEWFNQVKKYSHRDQISFNYSAWKVGFTGINYIPFTTINSHFTKRSHKKKMNEQLKSITDEFKKNMDYFSSSNSMDGVALVYCNREGMSKIFVDYKP